MGLYIQYGCGLSCPQGWLNFDVSPRVRLERMPIIGDILSVMERTLFPHNVRYGDIVNGLPVKDGSASGVYCSHVLEHIDRENVTLALANTYQLLEPGGIFRLVVPDLEWRVRKFIEGIEAGDLKAADAFMLSSHLGCPQHIKGVQSRLRASFGNSAHRWMYDFGLLRDLLLQAGFVRVRRCALNDCEDKLFLEVEDISRFEDDGNVELAIEARRPE